jgi:hypothetical protein
MHRNNPDAKSFQSMCETENDNVRKFTLRHEWSVQLI